MNTIEEKTISLKLLRSLLWSQRSGISIENLMILLYIEDNPGTLMKTLGAVLDREPSQVRKSVLKMEGLGYVRTERVKSESRNFKYLISLGPKGEKLVGRVLIELENGA